MFRILLFLLIIVPIVEISVLILVGRAIGLWPTLFLILFTGIFGAWFAKKEGLETFRLAQLQLQQGQLPSQAIIDGICILIGAILLLTPGIITDVIGLFLLLPPTRTVAKAYLMHVFKKMIKNGQFIIISRR